MAGYTIDEFRQMRFRLEEANLYGHSNRLVDQLVGSQPYQAHATSARASLATSSGLVAGA